MAISPAELHQRLSTERLGVAAFEAGIIVRVQSDHSANLLLEQSII